MCQLLFAVHKNALRFMCIITSTGKQAVSKGAPRRNVVLHSLVSDPEKKKIAFKSFRLCACMFINVFLLSLYGFSYQIPSDKLHHHRQWSFGGLLIFQFGIIGMFVCIVYLQIVH